MTHSTICTECGERVAVRLIEDGECIGCRTDTSLADDGDDVDRRADTEVEQR